MPNIPPFLPAMRDSVGFDKFVAAVAHTLYVKSPGGRWTRSTWTFDSPEDARQWVKANTGRVNAYRPMSITLREPFVRQVPAVIGVRVSGRAGP